MNGLSSLISLALRQDQTFFYEKSISAFKLMLVALAAALVSPLINSVDLIGGGLTSIGVDLEHKATFN